MVSKEQRVERRSILSLEENKRQDGTEYWLCDFGWKSTNGGKSSVSSFISVDELKLLRYFFGVKENSELVGKGITLPRGDHETWPPSARKTKTLSINDFVLLINQYRLLVGLPWNIVGAEEE